jgi:hypothetical protein
MKKFLTTALRIIAGVLVSIIGGWYLTCLIDLLPMDMPYSVEMFLNFSLDATGNSDLKNPSDMEMVVLLFYWAVSTLFIGAVILLLSYAIKRFQNRSG